MQFMTDFGQKIRALLKQRGLSQNAFAAALHTDGAWISQILNGHRSPPLDRLHQWWIVLKINDTEKRQLEALAALQHIPKPFLIKGISTSESNPAEIATLDPHIQTRVNTIAALEERRIPDDQLRTELREHIAIRQAMEIHLKRANRELAELRKQVAQAHALLTPPQTLAAFGPPETLDGLPPETAADLAAAEAEIIYDESQPTQQQQRPPPSSAAAKPRLRP
jgi:transcriptional regulator with XRE-family HTH domain